MSGSIHRFWIVVFGLCLPLRWSACAQTGSPGATQPADALTNIQQVLNLGNEALQANRRPVHLRAVLTATHPDERRLYLQDGEYAIVARYKHSVDRFIPGQVLEITGTAVSYVIQPQILAEDAQVAGLAPLPAPHEARVRTMAAGGEMAQYVFVRGCVRDMLWENNILTFLIRCDNAMFRFCVPSPPGTALPKSLIDAEVEVQGACHHVIDALRNVTAFRILGTSTNDMRVLAPGVPALFNRPLLTIEQLSHRPPDRIMRSKIAGTVLAHVPGHVLFLEDETGVARVELTILIPPVVGPTLVLEHEPQTQLEPGERVEAIGVRYEDGTRQLYLYDGEFRRIGRGPPPVAIPISMREISEQRNLHHLVSVTGRLVSCRVRGYPEPHTHSWVLDAGGSILQVRQEGGEMSRSDYPLQQWLNVTGVLEYEAGFVRGDAPNFGAVTLRARNYQDLVPAAPLPFWTLPEYRMALMAGAAVGAVALAFFGLQRRPWRRLKESEERCRALVDNSFDSTMVLTADGRVKYISPAGLALIGLQGKSVDPATISIASVVHPDDLPRIMQAHTDVLAEPGSSRRLTGYRVVRPDGTLRYAEAFGTNCMHVRGVEGVVVNIRDITERTQADEAARRSDAVARTVNYCAISLLECDTEEDVLWDLAKNCISQLGFVDCVVYLVDAGRQRLVQRAAMGPKSPDGQVIVNPIIIEWGRGIVGSAAAKGKAEVISDTRADSRYIVDDQRRLSEIAVPIVANGEVLGVIDSEHPNAGFFTEDHLKTLIAIASLCANKLVRIRAVQELRNLNAQLEQHVAFRTAALRQSEERFGKAFRASPAMLSIRRLPGGEYLDVNDSFLQAFGFSRGEVIGRTCGGLELCEDPLPCEESSSALKEGEPVRNRETVCRTKMGDLRFILRSEELIQLGDEQCILCVGQDITERKRADEELRRALEQERTLNQLKTSFVSMVSHEFRTPLEVILSSNNILDRYFDRLSPEKRAAQLMAIRKNVRRMNDLLDDVLVLGRIEAGRMDCEPAPIDLYELCRQAVVDIESASGGAGQVAFVACHLDAEAAADETILQHILSNLLGNAIKYSPAGARVDFTVMRRDGDAEFIIQDHGCGIPESDQASLFTAFYRGANVGQTPGSGLGLVIVRRCVESHGGTLSFKSVEGVGTTFTVSLPVFSGTGFFRKHASSSGANFTGRKTPKNETPAPDSNS